MLLFSESILILLVSLIILMISGSIILLITNRKRVIRKLGIYLLFLIILVIISYLSEQIIYQNFKDLEITAIFDIDLIIIFILFNLTCGLIQRNPYTEWFIYIHSVITLLTFHIIFAGIFGLFLNGTIIISMIGVLICCIIIPFDKDSKIFAIMVVFGLFIYIAYVINQLISAIILFGLILFIISFGYEPFRDKLNLIFPISIFSPSKVDLKILKPLKKKKSEKTNTEKKKKPKYWETRVKILQGALEKKENEQVYDREEIKTTWLQDYFSNRSHYGLEIVSQNYFTWTFLMKTGSQSQAKINGEALLARLSSIYPGIDGEIEIIPMYKKKIQYNTYLWEIKLPKSPYSEKITLISDFINLFHRNKQKITLYILWRGISPKKVVRIRKRIEKMHYKDEKEKEKLLKMWHDDLFNVKIFIICDFLKKEYEIEENEFQIVKGGIKSLTMSFKNPKKIAYLKEFPKEKIKNILQFNITSKQYITPNCVDFDFPEVIPLIKPFAIEDDNINFSSLRENNVDHILLGKYVFNGRRTERKIPIPMKDFAQSAVIFGQMGTGKTYLLAQFINEFYDKAPNIGILIINLGKGNQEAFYKLDTILKFGSSNFQVPYFVQGSYLEKNLQETAAYLIAALGLKNIVEKNMLNVMKIFLNKQGKLPESLDILFHNLLKYFKQYPYHIKFQTNILRALQNRVLSLLSDLYVKKTLELNSGIPKWFQEWRNGKKIYLDLSMCNIYVKRLITNAIFQLVRTLMPDVEAGQLQNIIVIDEAHQILEKPITHNYEDDDFISREQLEKIFTELLREFRSKGLSFIIVDQTPSRLFESVFALPSLKILFRLGYPCNTLFTGNTSEQGYLTLQKNRHALVFNGINGEKYVIETLDLSLQKQLPYQTEITEISCPYCNSLIDHAVKYCTFCGNPLLSDQSQPPEDTLIDYFENKEGDNN